MIRDGTRTDALMKRQQKRVLILCFLCQNLAIGLTYGAFGPLIPSTEDRFDLSRAAISMALSLFTFAIGTVSPVFGRMIERLPLVPAICGAAMISAFCYWGLAFAQSHIALFALYGCLGACAAILGILVPIVMVSRWFVEKRGRALSIANAPVFFVIAPFMSAAAIPVLGRAGVLVAAGAAFLLIIPLALACLRAEASHANASFAHASTDTGANGLPQDSRARWSFWFISIGAGIVSAAGTVYVVHIVPHALDLGLSLNQASLLISVYCAAGFVGTLIAGWLIDRLGPHGSLLLVTLCQVGAWLLLIGADSVALPFVGFALGMLVLPITTFHGAVLGTLYPPEQVGRAMGNSYFIKLPFIFGVSPIVGATYDLTGGYAVGFLLTALISAVAVMMFFLLRHMACRIAPATS